MLFKLLISLSTKCWGNQLISASFSCRIDVCGQGDFFNRGWDAPVIKNLEDTNNKGYKRLQESEEGRKEEDKKKNDLS